MTIKVFEALLQSGSPNLPGDFPEELACGGDGPYYGAVVKAAVEGTTGANVYGLDGEGDEEVVVIGH